MSLGVNILAALVRKAARTLGEDFDIEMRKCITGEDRCAFGHRVAAR